MHNIKVWAQKELQNRDKQINIFLKAFLVNQNIKVQGFGSKLLLAYKQRHFFTLHLEVKCAMTFQSLATIAKGSVLKATSANANLHRAFQFILITPFCLSKKLYYD